MFTGFSKPHSTHVALKNPLASVSFSPASSPFDDIAPSPSLSSLSINTQVTSSTSPSSHTLVSLNSSSPAAGSSAKAIKGSRKDSLPYSLRQRFVKTKLCHHHSKGKCCKGPACPFAHNEEELRVLPNLCKTTFCKLFASGMCLKTQQECSYAHSDEELRSTPEFFKTTLCPSYIQGNCASGASCRFAHGETELRPRLFRQVRSSGLSGASGTKGRKLSKPGNESSDSSLTTYSLSTPRSACYKEKESSISVCSTTCPSYSPTPSSGTGVKLVDTSVCAVPPYYRAPAPYPSFVECAEAKEQEGIRPRGAKVEMRVVALVLENERGWEEDVVHGVPDRGREKERPVATQTKECRVIAQQRPPEGASLVKGNEFVMSRELCRTPPLASGSGYSHAPVRSVFVSATTSNQRAIQYVVPTQLPYVHPSYINGGLPPPKCMYVLESNIAPSYFPTLSPKCSSSLSTIPVYQAVPNFGSRSPLLYGSPLPSQCVPSRYIPVVMSMRYED